MTATLPTNQRCPAFCRGEHRESYPLHVRRVGELHNEFTADTVSVDIQQLGNDEPRVVIVLSFEGEDVVNLIAPTTASALTDAFRALGQAGTLCDAIDEAVEILDTSYDIPGVSIVEAARCPACSIDDCDKCPTPRGSRLSAEGDELPTCCCGRRFVESTS